MFITVAAILAVRFLRTGGVAMLKMMGGEPDTHGEGHAHDAGHAAHDAGHATHDAGHATHDAGHTGHDAQQGRDADHGNGTARANT